MNLASPSVGPVVEESQSPVGAEGKSEASGPLVGSSGPVGSSGQAELNVGLLGSVAHGKSVFVKKVSGITTGKFREEQKRNMTLVLGHAGAKIYRCTPTLGPEPVRECRAYFSGAPDSNLTQCRYCGGPAELQVHLSFTDCPGHESLISQALSGISVMDTAILIVAANEPCPQPQTSEHLACLEIAGLCPVVVQSKIDLVTEAEAQESYRQIRAFLKGTLAERAPIIPISAVAVEFGGPSVEGPSNGGPSNGGPSNGGPSDLSKRGNLDLVLKYLCEEAAKKRLSKVESAEGKTSEGKRALEGKTDRLRFSVVRSFDLNKPGTRPEHLVGGVLGGTVLTGQVKLGDRLEIKPGVLLRGVWTPLVTSVVSLFSENVKLDVARPGGLVALGTGLDPAFTKGNRLVGNRVALLGTQAANVTVLWLAPRLMRSTVAPTGSTLDPDSGKGKVSRLVLEEQIGLTVGSLTLKGLVKEVNRETKLVKVVLATPVCCDLEEKVALSRRINKQMRLVGYGLVKRTEI